MLTEQEYSFSTNVKVALFLAMDYNAVTKSTAQSFDKVQTYELPEGNFVAVAPNVAVFQKRCSQSIFIGNQASLSRGTARPQLIESLPNVSRVWEFQGLTRLIERSSGTFEQKKQFVELLLALLSLFLSSASATARRLRQSSRRVIDSGSS